MDFTKDYKNKVNSLLMERWGYGKMDEAIEGHDGKPCSEVHPDVTHLEFMNKLDEAKEEGGFITFSDGYKFKEVSKSFAASNWDKVEVYGIDISSESESLIDSIDDLNQAWDAFGIEASGSLEAEELEETHGHAGKGCDEAHPDEGHEDYMDRLTIRRG